MARKRRGGDWLDEREAFDLMEERAEGRAGFDLADDETAALLLEGAIEETGLTALDTTPSGVVVPAAKLIPPVDELYIISYWVKEHGTPPEEDGSVHFYQGRRPIPPHLKGKYLTPKQLEREARRLIPGKHAARILAILPVLRTPAPGELRGRGIKEKTKIQMADEILTGLQEKYGQQGAAKLIGVTPRSIRGYNEFFAGAKGKRTRAPSEKVFARLLEIQGLVDD